MIKHMGEVRLFNNVELERLKLIHSESEDRDVLKTVRELRTRIYKNVEKKNFVCLVTSVASGGGGSFVARSLAATIALDTTKTALLIDGNLYAPSVGFLLPVKPLVGLTDYLDDASMSVDEIIYASGVPRLRVVPVGNNRDGGTEKITSERMSHFMNDVKTRYSDRAVIVDGPSVGEYDAEIRILGGLCDMVILVVPNNMVTELEISEAIESIGKNKIFGIVMNNSKS